jgi:predicted ATP-grasp superfamily ATP-dependent carboligase
MSTKVQIPDTVILEMQHKVKEFCDEIKQHETTLAGIRVKHNEAEKQRAYAVLKLRETLDFLQEHNSDATEDWFAEADQSRDRLLVDEKPMLLEV